MVFFSEYHFVINSRRHARASPLTSPAYLHLLGAVGEGAYVYPLILATSKV
eukprot:c35489_g1_i1 orf=27-179(-)